MEIPAIFRYVQESDFTANHAAESVGLHPGDHIQLLVDVGDAGPGGSVTVKRGHHAIVSDFYWLGGYWRMNVNMIDSPGQAKFQTALKDVKTFWTTEPLPLPPPETGLDWILSDEDIP